MNGGRLRPVGLICKNAEISKRLPPLAAAAGLGEDPVRGGGAAAPQAHGGLPDHKYRPRKEQGGARWARFPPPAAAAAKAGSVRAATARLWGR